MAIRTGPYKISLLVEYHGAGGADFGPHYTEKYVLAAVTPIVISLNIKNRSYGVRRVIGLLWPLSVTRVLV
jgi:hypothetical protein